VSTTKPFTIRNGLSVGTIQVIDSSGNYVLYANIYSNATYYANTINLSLVPTTLPVGWSYATSGIYSGAGGLPTVAATPSCSS
jgi:hypothetical protein